MSKKVKCPFCNKRDFKEKIISHIDKDHEDMIPENYDAARILYDTTHKTYGKCVVCGAPTDWNPKTEKYSRLCDKPSCKESLRNKFKKNMIKVYGKTTLLDDIDHQERMLANRSISGVYTYSDGTKFTYTGSYELNAIRFMDEVLECNSKDIIMPGPTIEYEDRNGGTRKWITDIYYIPYNLIIEVKDGGKNPNTRTMTVYRDKQIDKEKSIIKLGKYNYLRLTDNDFGQLMEIMAILKYEEINPDMKNDNVVIRINESTDEAEEDKTSQDHSNDVDYVMLHKRLKDLKIYFNKSKEEDESICEFMGVAGVGAPPQGINTGVMMTQYTPHPNSFTGEKDGFGYVGDDKKSAKSNANDDNDRVQIVDRHKDMQDTFYAIYRYNDEPKKKKGSDTLYEYVTGRKLLTTDQIEYDDDFDEVNLYHKDSEGLYDTVQSIKDTIKKNYIGEPYDYMPLYDLLDINMARVKLEGMDPNDIIMEDMDGYFFYNTKSNVRSRSYKSILEMDHKPYTKSKDDIGKEERESENNDVADANSSGMYKVLDDKYDSQESLEDDWSEYQNLPGDAKRASDDMSIRIFGKTNSDRYKELKSKYLNIDIPYEDLSLTEALSIADIERAKDYGIILHNKEFEIEFMRNWSLYSGIYCILPCETYEELKEQKLNFDSMDESLRRSSDNKLLEVFGCTNETMYNFLESTFVDDAMDYDYSFPLVEYTKETSSYSNYLDTPFYDLAEIETFRANKPFGEYDKEREEEATNWFKKIKSGKFDRLEWIEKVRKLATLNHILPSDEKRQELLEYGWNPYLEFNSINRARALDRFKKSMLILERSALFKLGSRKIEFDEKGNLLIKKVLTDKNYQELYNQVHRLGETYYKTNNVEGLKSACALMWHITLRVDDDIKFKCYDEYNKKELNDIRARCLNDFTRYHKKILIQDKTFNFINYYESSPINKDNTVIHKSTIKHTIELMKQVIKL